MISSEYCVLEGLSIHFGIINLISGIDRRCIPFYGRERERYERIVQRTEELKWNMHFVTIREVLW